MALRMAIRAKSTRRQTVGAASRPFDVLRGLWELRMLWGRLWGRSSGLGRYSSKARQSLRTRWVTGSPGTQWAQAVGLLGGGHAGPQRALASRNPEF